MLPIAVCSIASLSIFMYKWSEFRKAELSNMNWFENFLNRLPGSKKKLESSLQNARHPAVNVVRSMINTYEKNSQHTEGEAKRISSLELQKLEKYLPTLAFLAEISPLLGLLGTVIGMIDMFTELQNSGQGSVSVEFLASGIYKALLTTAAGLSVAVPTLAAHKFLSSKSDELRLQLASVIQQVLYKISGPQVPDKKSHAK